MPRFFSNHIQDEKIFLRKEDAYHIYKVLRMQVGDAITLCDENGTDYACRIYSLSPENCTAVIESSCPCAAEPGLHLTLFQSLCKGDKFEWIVQKAVELGIYQIVPVLTKRCVSRPDAKAMEKKITRYQKIAMEAAKQCGRGIIPAVQPLLHWEQACKQAAALDKNLLFYEKGGKSLASLITGLNIESMGIFIGSEGGFEPEEVELAEKHAIIRASLGPRILRCETAPLAAIANIMQLSGNMG